MSKEDLTKQLNDLHVKNSRLTMQAEHLSRSMKSLTVEINEVRDAISKLEKAEKKS